MMNLQELTAELNQAGIAITLAGATVLLETGVIKGGVKDPNTQEWQIPKTEVQKFIKARNPAPPGRIAAWIAAGLAGVTALATLAGNLDDISSFTCKQGKLFCGKEESSQPSTSFKASLQRPAESTCPQAYLVPDADQPKALSLFRAEDNLVTDIIDQLDAASKYVLVGSRQVDLRLTGQDFKGTWPLIPAKLRFEVERVADANTGGVALVADECGGGLDQLIFDPVNLVNAVNPYLLSASIQDESKGNAPTKVTVKPNETVMLAGRFNCTQAGTFKVQALVSYDIDSVPQPDVKSDPFTVVCPAELDVMSDLNSERKPQKAMLNNGTYAVQYAPETEADLNSPPPNGQEH